MRADEQNDSFAEQLIFWHGPHEAGGRLPGRGAERGTAAGLAPRSGGWQVREPEEAG